MLIAIIIILIIVLAVLIISLYTYMRTFHTKTVRQENIYDLPEGDDYAGIRPIMTELVNGIVKVDFEEVWITSFDGTKLFGRYYHVCDGAPVHIEMHGYRSTALRDFCGGNQLARGFGHNALLVDQRAHGRSEGNTITFGVNESRDCLEWVKYINNRFGDSTPIFLSGVSMGAATVVTAIGLDLPDNVVGVIADCPYSSPKEIICKVIKEMKLPPDLAWPFVMLGAWLYGGFDIEGGSAVDSIARSKVPVLLIHGEIDGFVPCEMSKQIKNARPEGTRLETFPNARHGLSYVMDFERYKRVVSEFTEECLKNRKI